MQIDVIQAEQALATLRPDWARLCAAQDLYSPFFAFGFFDLVARHRQDLRVAVASDDGQVCGLLPFHARPGGRGVPLAGPICDYQGVIGDMGVSAATVMRGAGLSCLDFDHVPATMPLFAGHAFQRSISPLIDLSRGLQVWKDERAGQTSALKTVERKRRKMAREVGPLRFVAHDTAPEAWAQFLTWKRAALQQMGVRVILDQPWVMAVLDSARDVQSNAFAGQFSTLYAGDRLVAAHLGLRSDRVLHWWFPTYDPEMGRYSAGLALLMQCAEHAAEGGVQKIDLGRGDERYKTEFANDACALVEGSLEGALQPAAVARRLRKTLHRTADMHLSPRMVEFQRKALNRALRAGAL